MDFPFETVLLNMKMDATVWRKNVENTEVQCSHFPSTAVSRLPLKKQNKTLVTQLRTRDFFISAQDP